MYLHTHTNTPRHQLPIIIFRLCCNDERSPNMLKMKFNIYVFVHNNLRSLIGWCQCLQHYSVEFNFVILQPYAMRAECLPVARRFHVFVTRLSSTCQIWGTTSSLTPRTDSVKWLLRPGAQDNSSFKYRTRITYTHIALFNTYHNQWFSKYWAESFRI